ncbi:transporter substrate-binding domain-containing protein [Actinotalea fermentans]|uniref:Basic amino acid ABC transporter substrate-binding protein n=1 Tax=Actinotalea fermentans TaxID=43671 RepID=A0A511YW92_9CELL|nr:transporter substrate-binding domain-containing protein [Actinotalea fermentans]KGM17399.1 amino acid ABC transporter substrate-binding protein [Actinotalea fermentans ATCC 43279 = JCM 9966 = DSM 3133]GEN79396.1 basic amino acid ABC transporter substrate-binding protein [Actinotalea fermentans]
MRSLTRLAVPVAAATLLLAGCASTGDDDASPAAGDGEVTLLTEGKLTVCTNPPYEPFEYEEDGQVVGLDMDIVGAVAEDLGAELEIKITPFEGIQSGADLDSGNCDIVASGITITEEREAKMDFSDPYFDADQGLLVPAGSGIASVEELDGLTVGVQTATTGATFAADNALNVVEFEDLGLQIEALRNGTIDAVINDIAVLGPFASDDFEVGTTFPTGEQYGLGIKTGNTALLDAVNATLERIASDGTYEEIYTKYIGTAPSAG